MAITYTNQDGTKRTEYAGRVVGTRFHAAYDDDYNYAIVVDEAGEDREVLIFTTAFACGDEGWPSVEVDAPAEILAAREAKMALAAEIAAAKKIRKGDTVEVIKGRKVPKGTVGEVFWLEEQRYGTSVTTRLGLKTPDGETVWVDAHNCQNVKLAALLAA